MIDSFDSNWDSVLRLEESAFDNGYADGEHDSVKDTIVYKQGFQAGYLRAFALGIELGFITTVIEEENAKADQSQNEPASRYSKRLKSIIKLAEEIPLKNSPDIDFDEKVREMRALYKLCGSPSGSLRQDAQESNVGW